MAFDYKQEVFRKLIHLSSFWMVAFIALVPRVWAVAFFALASVVSVTTEYVVYRRPDSLLARLYGKVFARVLRDKERAVRFRLSGGPYVFVAAFVLALLATKEQAMFGLSVLLLCDTLAALIGRRFGKHKIMGKKSLEGTAAFLAGGVLLTVVFAAFGTLSPHLMLAGVMLGCMGDLLNEKCHIDDNFSIPILACLPFLI